MRITTLVTILGLLAGTGVPLYGQSLADVAKKEEDRRKTVKDSGKVYGNKDLKPVPQPETPATATSPAAADTGADAKKPAAEKAEEKAEAKGVAKDQKYWADRMKALREQLDNNRTFAEALQSRINGLTADFAARDDPAQRAQVGVARDKAIADLERLKVQIVDGTKAIADLEEEARRAGVPPGWLR